MIPRAQICSPLIAGTRKRWCCSSVPNLKIGGVAIAAWAPSPAATPPLPPGARQLLGPDRVVDVVAALAAELLGVLEAEEAELAAALVQLARELARLLPLVDVGGDLLADEAPHRLAELLVLLGERRQQGALAACP